MNITVKSVGIKLAGLIAIGGMLGLSTVVSVSKDTLPVTVSAWYDALRHADAEMFEMILDDTAQIELKFIDITQNKKEFLDSLDEWEHANKGAKILTRLESASASSAVVDVCYRFPSNETFNRETFTYQGNKIIRSVQEEISELCDKF